MYVIVCKDFHEICMEGMWYRKYEIQPLIESCRDHYFNSKHYNIPNLSLIMGHHYQRIWIFGNSPQTNKLDLLSNFVHNWYLHDYLLWEPEGFYVFSYYTITQFYYQFYYQRMKYKKS